MVGILLTQQRWSPLAKSLQLTGRFLGHPRPFLMVYAPWILLSAISRAEFTCSSRSGTYNTALDSGSIVSLCTS